MATRMISLVVVGWSLAMGAVEAADPPPAEAGAASRPDQPFRSSLITRWGAAVTAANAWQDYPRPTLVRPSWTNLNGSWDYAIVPIDASLPSRWDGRILVPFCVESRLSGVQRLLHADQAIWYARDLECLPAEGRRTLLHIEASDYRTTAWVNGVEVGRHVGGNLPFSFDITEALRRGEGARLVIRVEDATADHQLRGKQSSDPKGIFYTQVSGIHGTVWLEEVPEDHVHDLSIETSCEGRVTVRLHAVGVPRPVRIIASQAGRQVAESRAADATSPIELQIPEPRLWSPASPTLYDLEIHYGDDRFTSYAGIREVGRVQGADGEWRFTLNREPIFHFGPLDQGWWPDGLLTPPSDEAMRWDVDFLKAAGFNTIRKHVKVEPRRFYAYCDAVGMMVWQDQVAGFPGPRWTQLEPHPSDVDWPEPARQQFHDELESMVSHLDTHPSIVMWVPFNEAWGQHRSTDVGAWTMARDPSRLVNIASGGNFWSVGHVVDAHHYPHPGFPFERGRDGRFDGFVKVVGEFGGHGFPVKGHLWDESKDNWGYGGLPKSREEYVERYRESLRRLADLRGRGIAAGIYTQTTDVEGEVNGLVTYDRGETKITAADLRAMHEQILGGAGATD